MLELTSKAPEQVEMIDLFSVDGKTYQIPKKVPPATALRLLDVMRADGEVQMLAQLLPAVLGDDAHKALMTCQGMTTEQLSELMADVRTYVFGQLEETTGN